MDKGLNHIDKRINQRKHKRVIAYAKKMHPELDFKKGGNVTDEKLNNWIDALGVLSPEISTNKELGSSALLDIHNYGGRINSPYAKQVADTGKSTRSGKATLGIGNTYGIATRS